jgi:4-hydroxyproline epimerase
MPATQAHRPTRPHTFSCIDGHTCGNPVRLVLSGHPALRGGTMSEKRGDFIRRFDWVRTSLMFEPRGHDQMSGGFLYPSTRKDCDTAVLFIEVSGCLPMCGHGAIGIVTFALENGLVKAKRNGVLGLDTPAGRVEAFYQKRGTKISNVRFVNVPGFLFAEGVAITCPGLGPLKVDVAYGGNFYAIVDPQKNYRGLDALTAFDLQRLSPVVRELVNKKVKAVHPDDSSIRGVSHVQWTGKPRNPKAHGRNAVFYGEKALDRSPCGTGTSARLAQLHAKGKLKKGVSFVHESLIGTLFEGRIEEETRVGRLPGVRPSVKGGARQTGRSVITVDPADPLWRGFQVL